MKLSNNFILTFTLGLSGGWVYKNNKNDDYYFPMLVDYLVNYDIEKYKKNALNHLNVEFVMDGGSIYFLICYLLVLLKYFCQKMNLRRS